MGVPGLRCIKCSEADTLSLDLDDCKTFRCRGCDDEFTADEVAEHLHLWGRVLAWVETVSAEVAGRVGA